MPEQHSEYAQKPSHYFAGARKKFVDDLPPGREAKMLEVGCGNGDTAAYALATGKCGWCAGIELCAEPAEQAAKRLHDVRIGDVEQMTLPYSPGFFDVLVMSEVVEHFRDPWTTLKRLAALLKPGALVLSGSPNVAHRSVIRMLLRGRWDYASVGIMDRTHLRWFTPATYRELFEDCGFEVVSVGPPGPLRKKARWFNRLTLGRWQHLLHSQIYLKARRRPQI
jgi:2-polyprenyl-3-methyl-5-hydroxy-6-metoxy-1,4-benzoquinol methylase